MRTFGTLLAVALLVSAAGCGGGSSSGNYTSPTGRSPATGGQCPGSTSGQTCTGEQAYYDCLTKACGTEAKACFGNNYLKGDYTGGSCSDFMTCMMACPCDSTADACTTQCAVTYVMSAAGAACATCTTTLQACTTLAACTAPVCTTGTTTTTTTSTGTNCAALQTCCGKMADATIKAACQSAITSAGGDDATCALILPSLQTYCP